MLIEKQYNAKKSNTDGGRGSDKSAVSIINQSINHSEPIARFFFRSKIIYSSINSFVCVLPVEIIHQPEY